MRKVMVVEDDALMRIHLKQMLVENGFDVAEAADGIEAISVYQAFEPDMVFLNITISDKDGLAALKEIKVINPNAQVAIIVVEGQQEKDVVSSWDKLLQGARRNVRSLE